MQHSQLNIWLPKVPVHNDTKLKVQLNGLLWTISLFGFKQVLKHPYKIDCLPVQCLNLFPTGLCACALKQIDYDIARFD